MNRLASAGLVTSYTGVWVPGGAGYQSVAQPTPLLLELMDPVVDIGEPRGDHQGAEVIVLRDKDKGDIDYQDTPETESMRTQIQTLNSELAKLELLLDGQPSPVPLMRRIFNEDFGRGGRLYAHGPSYQNIKSKRRLDLQLRIDGVMRPTVEIDYSALHITMAYAEANLALPEGDQYAIDGFNRSLVKRAVNILLNAKTRNLAISAMTEDLHHGDHDLWLSSNLPTRYRSNCRPLVDDVIFAIEKKHHPIAEFFGSDCGAKFQKKDSEMIIRIMEQMISRTGRCPLPMHDSLLVADIDRGILTQTMVEVAEEEGLSLCLKVSP